MQCLDDITVVSFEHAVAAPLASRHLADLGARVIKVEPEGRGDFARHYDDAVDGLSSYFVWLNRSKESVAVNPRSEDGQVLIRRLLEHADVVIHNLSPQAAERLGLRPDDLRQQRPELIACSISGYGEGGPKSGRRAYDLLIQFETGLVDLTGDGEHAAKVPISIADIATGMYTLSNVLAALHRRSRDGQGASIHVSMLDCLAEWMSQPAYLARGRGEVPPRSGMRHASIAPYGPYETADGEQLVVAVQNDAEWGRLCREVLGDAGLAEDERFGSNADRVANRTALEDVLSARFARCDREQLAARLDAAGVANGPLARVTDLLENEQLRVRGRWSEIRTPSGSAPALVSPLDPGTGSPRMDPLPALGEHTESVAAEFLGESGPQADPGDTRA